MKKSIILLGIMSLLISCNDKKNEPKTKSITEIVPQKTNEKKVDSLPTVQYIENDSITHSWITELTKISKTDKRFKVVNELRPNRHWDYMDTIKTLTFDQSNMTILSTKGFYGLWSAELKNREIPLWNYIKIGMEKFQLEETMGTKILTNKVEVGNLEQTTVFEFEFNNGKLDRIYVVGFED